MKAARRKAGSWGVVLCGVLALGWAPARAERPNIIVLLTDDQGWADLSCQRVVPDIRTPHLDRLAAEGVRFTDGYITAPQCSPSRAGLVTGRYQQRFGLDNIADCPLPKGERTIAGRLREAGYVTGMVGKWHLDPNSTSRKWAREHLPGALREGRPRLAIPFAKARPYFPDRRGYDESFTGSMKRYWATYTLAGEDLEPPGWVNDSRFRLEVQNEAALAFVRRHRDRPFFLQVGYYAPHTPLEATKEYLDRFPGDMPERRRYALAMISAIDDGVGRLLATLAELGIDERTLIFFISDNGAPLKMTREDSPVDRDPGGWDGSLNDPLLGEKGMLTEGGIRVPFLARWKGTLPAGRVYSEPVIALDIGATALARAGLPQPADLDGVDLLPYLTGEKEGAPHDALYWRFWNQAAVRKGDWKFLRAGREGRFLFHLGRPEQETVNLLARHPEVAAELEGLLEDWCAGLMPGGIPKSGLNGQEAGWYRHYLSYEE